MFPLQHQFTDSNLMAVLHNENHTILQNNFRPFNFLQSSCYDASLLHPDIVFSNPRPLLTTVGEGLDRSVSSLANVNTGIQVMDSPFDTGSSNVDYLNSPPISETVASRVDQLMPIDNPVDTEVLYGLSKTRCPIAKVGYPLPSTQDEQVNISNNVESQEPTQNTVLIKRKSKYCSSATPQSEGTMATKARARRILSSRIYRAKVAEAIKTLKSDLPHSEKECQASILDNVIDYIKFLKLRLNVLSQSRLNGEASTHSFVHIEGYGHYLLHPQTYHQPLEEIVGHLFKSDPQVANELLEYKGLAILPMDCLLNPSSYSCQP